jgi:signal peptidase I
MLPEPRRRRLRIMIVGAVALGALVAAAWFAFLPSVGSYRMPSASMTPTIAPGEVVDVNKDAYGDGQMPDYGDLVLFHPPVGAADALCGVKHPAAQMCPRATPGLDESLQVKRVIGRPGDRIAMDRTGTLYFNGHRVFEYSSHEIRGCHEGAQCAFPVPVTVPPGTVLVIGDNRGESSDSRFWGPVPIEAIVGRVDDCPFSAFSCHPLD